MAKPQTGPAPDAPSKRPSRGARTIPLDARDQAEAVARWIEGLFSKHSEMIVREREWSKNHPEDKDSAGRLRYYEHALATAHQIAYYLRAHKLRGPIDGTNT